MCFSYFPPGTVCVCSYLLASHSWEGAALHALNGWRKMFAVGVFVRVEQGTRFTLLCCKRRGSHRFCDPLAF